MLSGRTYALQAQSRLSNIASGVRGCSDQDHSLLEGALQVTSSEVMKTRARSGLLGYIGN